jgi:hypothetical protein
MGDYQRVREILGEVERTGRMQEQSQGWKRILKTILPRKIGVLKGSTAINFEAATFYETLAPSGQHKFTWCPYPRIVD